MPLFGPPNVEKLKAKRDVKGLVTALRYQDSTVREAAEQALVEIGALAVPSLISDLKKDYSFTRSLLMQKNLSLATKNPEKEDEYLVMNAMRHRTATVLIKIGASAVETLAIVLKDKDVDTRVVAAMVAGRINDQRTVELLIAALKDEQWNVRFVAAEALGRIGDARVVEPLIAALKDEQWDVRFVAVEALGRIGDARVAEPLIAAHKDEPIRGIQDILHPDLRADMERRQLLQTVEKALEKIGTPTVAPLIATLKDGDVWAAERSFAAEMLGKIGDPQAIESLVTALKDKEWLVRTAAAKSLGKIGDPRAVEPLRAVLEDGSVGKDAEEALKKLG